jgi:hypothetical protein
VFLCSLFFKNATANSGITGKKRDKSDFARWLSVWQTFTLYDPAKSSGD